MKVSVFLAVALAVLAAGCGSSDTADEPATTEAPTTTVTVATTTTIPPTTTTTTVASTTTAAPATTTSAAAGGIIPGEDADVDAVVVAYEVVFSSETTYDEKVPYLVDSEGLEETVLKYQETGDLMGGVGALPSAVTINGETADVTYDLLFSGTPTYPNLSGDAVLLDDTWKITREMFCSIMTSARVGCPAS